MTGPKIIFQIKLIVFTLLFFLAAIQIFAQTKSVLMAGTSRMVITPTTPIPMSGYGGRDDPFKGVHDDIFVRAIAFSDGKNKAVLISAEVIGISEELWKGVTDALIKKTGIKKEFIMFSAVHNHAGPVLNVYNESPSPAVRAYIEELKGKIINAATEAFSNMVAVEIGAGKGECKMNINRRASNGNGKITLGRNPYQPCDHELGVIRIDDKKGTPRALLLNWPCHAVVLGPKNYMITGDWPGAASAYIEKAYGENFIAPITIGASGDINPIYGPHMDFESNNAEIFGKDAIGEDLGIRSREIAKEIKVFAAGAISASQREISLPAKEKKDGEKKQAEGDSVKVRFSVLKIGNLVFAGVSGEVFNEIGVRLRQQSPYAFTFMVTHCNGSSGYLITDSAYDEGGYEVGATRVRSGAEKAIIANLLEMINKL
jgi:neutral ceramidase